MNIKTLAVAALAAATLPACASIFSGGTQKVGLSSTPDGATVTVMDKRGDVVFKGTTPTEAKLARGDGFFSAQRYKVRFEKPGLAPEEVNLRSTANGWTFGNLLLGGVIGIVIDGATGGIFAYRPKNVDATLGEEAALQILPLSALSDEEREDLIPIS